VTLQVDIIDADKTEWWDKYKYDIPVLHIDGQYWAKHRCVPGHRARRVQRPPIARITVLHVPQSHSRRGAGGAGGGEGGPLLAQARRAGCIEARAAKGVKGAHYDISHVVTSHASCLAASATPMRSCAFVFCVT